MKHGVGLCFGLAMLVAAAHTDDDEDVEAVPQEKVDAGDDREGLKVSVAIAHADATASVDADKVSGNCSKTTTPAPAGEANDVVKDVPESPAQEPDVSDVTVAAPVPEESQNAAIHFSFDANAAGAESSSVAHFLSLWPADVMGVPETELIRVLPGFASSINYRLRIPNWVVEVLTEDSVNGPFDRGNSRFSVDKLAPSWFRQQARDYSRSGYSRGHMASAGGHKDSQASMDSTFLLSANIIPQELSMNGGDWYRLELLSRRLTRSFETVRVISGPLFLPQEDPVTHVKTVSYQVIGPNNVAVPTHFFKIIVCERPKNTLSSEGAMTVSNADGSVGVAAFVMPNRPIMEENDLSAYQTSLVHVLKSAGLTFRDSSGGTAVRLYDLCKRGMCEEKELSAESAGRVQSWRRLGFIKAADSVISLEEAWQGYERDRSSSDDEPSWLYQMYRTEYEKRKDYLSGRSQ